MNKSVPFVQKVFSYMKGEEDIAICAMLLHDAERKCGLKLLRPSPATAVYLEEEGALLDMFEQQYFEFLDLTNLVLQTSRFSDVYDIASNVHTDFVFGATARAWGEMYSRWANSRCWLGRTDWTYIDFFAGNIATDYWGWAEAAFDCVKFLTDYVRPYGEREGA